ncbi:thioesterase II family protein [Bordetella genomosp. 13]|uniref:Thioesterase domain-containing protein n=1 Tax=Bordetella genomosp. 13 TaxID=463040 RepID=A0A1W6Z9S7_9BORD|nr:alpha/beta fold hydrolase [Bordetella genomosp. 13]ARP93995.1 hypothetical protein CAL15_06125 [Bordetella genomosp. 13]
MPAFTLYCLPCAGASATMYQRWRRQVPSWLAIEPVELPGRGRRLNEAPIARMDALVDALAPEWLGRLQTPYALLGMSMGALIAYEFALLAARGGRPPQALFVAASAAPGTREDAARAALESEAELIAEMRALGGTSEAVFAEPELLGPALAALKADFRVCASARAALGPALDCPMHVYGGREDRISQSQLLAWQHATTSTCTLTWLAGGHFFMREQESDFLRHVVTAIGL